MQEFLAENGVAFESRDVSADEKALEELEETGYLTTPVTVVDGKVVVGFDRKRLLELTSGTTG